MRICYRRFIKGYTGVARPLSNLTKKEQPWNWTNECQRAFDKLKQRFISAPILVDYHPQRQKIIETDASDLPKGAVLNQLEPDGKWHPVGFDSKKFSDTELNYDFHDKEMVVIVAWFKEWRHYLISQRVVVYTDHRNLEYFNTTKILNRHQARWAEILSDFDFVITYCSGDKNGKANALSCRTDPELEEGSAPHISMFKPGQLPQIQRDNHLLVQLLSQSARVPTRGTAEAAGYDLYSAEHTVIPPHSRTKVSTEISILVTLGTYGRIAPRSGLAMKHSIDIAAGVLDADYRGTVIAGLVNNSRIPFEVKVGDRIAQLILECIQTPEVSKVDFLPETVRAYKGFGSTGVAETPILDRKIMAVQTRNAANSEWSKLILEAGAKDEQWSAVRSALMSGKLINNLSLQNHLWYLRIGSTYQIVMI